MPANAPEDEWELLPVIGADVLFGLGEKVSVPFLVPLQARLCITPSFHWTPVSSSKVSIPSFNRHVPRASTKAGKILGPTDL
jgi:hypothetical protein